MRIRRFVIIAIIISSLFYLNNLYAIEPDWELLKKGEVQTAIEPFEVKGEGIKKRGVALVLFQQILRLFGKLSATGIQWVNMSLI